MLQKQTLGIGRMCLDVELNIAGLLRCSQYQQALFEESIDLYYKYRFDC